MTSEPTRDEMPGERGLESLPVPSLKVIRTILFGLSLRGYSVWTLLAANLIAIISVLFDSWPILAVMALYCGQSIVIGCFRFARILTLKQFDLSGIKVDGKELETTRVNKRHMALLFAGLYGGFHAAYVLVLCLEAEGLDFTVMREYAPLFALSLAGFAVHHCFSFIYNRRRDAQKKKNVGLLFTMPFLRIVPMHLTILFGFLLLELSDHVGVLVLLLFMCLKAVADILMHLLEHVDPHVWLEVAREIRDDDEETAKGLTRFADLLLREDIADSEVT